ncbi:PilZ domain-containing protein [Parerythrobacter jejuensis]|uniref:PilZ domain-containing protein n=1 Tax=Parerythrobacter jejuensis TaxID=795812 RepID=A0A845AWB7_9SPHN|nr:PilZ domain-containing protein [Parerythrobacter jejuensis]MXP31088.1 hypothetical protein [Parerythrobacter jejuensis]MXP33848.1 hypothetical protein [Parerythrobacter jejuensis]
MPDIECGDDEATNAGRRKAARSSLLLRSAKVICQSGEYYCVIHDVSTDGAGLRFLHAAPPEPRVLLQLANGDTYPIERVWLGKRQAGYRFASPIVLADFVHEPSPYESRPIRLKVSADATVVEGTLAHHARLVDLSCAGAMIDCDARLPIAEHIALEFGGDTPRRAIVCWQDNAQHGVSFHQPMSVEELANTVLSLQPFTIPNPARKRTTTGIIRAA